MSQILTDNEFTLWQDRKEVKEILLKSLLNRVYFKQKNGEIGECPSCGGRLEPKLSHNAFSRRVDVYVCSKCGIVTLVKDFVKPLSQFVCYSSDGHDELNAIYRIRNSGMQGPLKIKNSTQILIRSKQRKNKRKHVTEFI